MAIGDRFQIIDNQLYLSQGMLNVYYYKGVSGSTVNAATCLYCFMNSVLPLILPIQVANVTHPVLTCINLDDATDFDLQAPVANNVGTNTGVHPYASFGALSFIYRRATRACRNGWKRISGFDEENVAGNVIETGFMNTVTDLADQLEADIYTTGASYRPVILRKNAVPALSTDFPILGVDFVGLTTQNTRKMGRGM